MFRLWGVVCAVALAACGGGGSSPSAGPVVPVPSPGIVPTPSPELPPEPTPEVLGRWVPAGPEGGGVVDLAVAADDPRRLYAATTGGVFRSFDGGENWQAASRGLADARGFLPQGGVLSLAIDPHDSATLYAGTTLGVWKSVDGADTWVSSSNGLVGINDGPQEVRDLAIDPRDPATVYAGAAGLFRSADGAETWERIETPLQQISVYSVAVHPKVDGTLLVGTGGGGILISVDGGNTWSHLNDSPMTATTFVGFAFDPSDGNRVFAAASRAVFQSTDGGASWERFTRGLPPGGQGVPAVTSIAVDLNRPERLYAGTPSGLFALTLGDLRHWERAGLEGRGVVSMLSIPGGALYAGTFGLGVFSQLGAADEWGARSTGLRASRVMALVADPGRPGVVFAGAVRGGVSLSEDFGRSWRTVGEEDLQGATITGLAVDPGDGATLFAAGGNGRFFWSDDSGRSWTETPLTGVLQPDWGAGPKVGIGVDADGDRIVLASGYAGVRVTDDRGLTWARRGVPSVSEFGCAPFTSVGTSLAAPGVVYLSHPFYGVSRSSDRGDTFSPLECGFAIFSDSATGLAVDPRDPSNVYAGTLSGLLKSVDAGETWQEIPVGSAPARVTAIAIDPVETFRVYASTEEGVFQSRDFGESWARMSLGLLGAPAQDLIIDPAGGGALLIATDEGSVQRIELAD